MLASGNEPKNKDNHSSALWSIEDDTFFHAQGLLNHSAGTGQYVFVTWNENYLVNFVFKTSSNAGAATASGGSSSSASSSSLGQSTLAKVRVMMPQCPPTESDPVSLKEEVEQYEEIEQVLILEYNTLLLMRSGRVYYFSSVKSVHLVPWLMDVRCLANSNHSAFSAIHCTRSRAADYKLHLDVYRDLPLLGKHTSSQKLLLHSYDITFDENNLFGCSWLDERYVLNSSVVTPRNRTLFNKLAQLGENSLEKDSLKIRENEVSSLIKDYQEVHLFGISCNLYMLCSGDFAKLELAEPDEALASQEQSTDYSIHLLNTYQSAIRYICLEEDHELVIVLLESGYMDLWYSCERLQGAMIHRVVQVLPFLHFDYCPLRSTFYFVSFDQVARVQIVREASDCRVEETHKSVAGMVACTWVEELRQLVCLSSNNIFYRLSFKSSSSPSTSKEKKSKKKEETAGNQQTICNYEPLRSVYALDEARIDDLLRRSSLLSNLLRQPKNLQERIQLEYQKQLLLSMAPKTKLVGKLFSSYIEYHLLVPTMDYFMKKYPNMALRNVEFHQDGKVFEADDGSQSVSIDYYALIFFEISGNLSRSKQETLLAIFSSSNWYLQIFTKQQSLLVELRLPNLQRKGICFIVKCSTIVYRSRRRRRKLLEHRSLLERFQLRFLTYVSHSGSHLMLEFPLSVTRHFHPEGFKYLFSHNLLYLMDDEMPEENMDDKKGILCSSSMDFVYKHELPLRNVDAWNTISQSFPNSNSSSATARVLLLYFLGVIFLQVEYLETEQKIIISSHNPDAIFHFKVHCFSVLTDGKDVKDGSSQDNKRLMETEGDIERLNELLADAEPIVSNECSTIYWEKLMKAHLNLRTAPFHQIFR